MAATSTSTNVPLQSLARGLVEADTVDTIASEVLRVTRDLFDWDAFIFSERIDGTDEFIRVTAWDTLDGERAELDPAVHPPTPYRTVPELHRGEPLLIEAEEAAKQPLNRFGDETRLSASLLFAPIRYRGTLHGICSVQSYTPRRYDRSDLSLLALVCEMTAPALRRARAERELETKIAQLAEAHDDVQCKTAVISAMYEIAKSVHVMSSPDDLFGRVHEVVRSVTGTDSFVVALCAPDGTALQFVHAAGRECPECSTGAEIVRRALRARESMRMDEDAGTCTAADSGVEGPGTASTAWLGVPLVAEGILLGAMATESSPHSGRHGLDEIEMLEFVGAEVARAMLQMRKDGELRRSEERFRRAIACAGAVPYEREFGRETWTHMGDGVSQLLGYAPEEITADLWKKIVVETIPRGDLAGVPFEDALFKIVSGESSRWNADSLVVRSDGAKRWLSDCSVLMLNDDGSPKGTLGILQDVTDRVNSLRLHEALSTLGQLLSSAMTPRDVALAAARVMDEVFGWDAFFLDIHDGRTGLVTSIVNFDVVDFERREVESSYLRPYPPSATFQWVLKQGALLIRDATASTEGRPSAIPYGDSGRRSASLMFVPVRCGENEIVGMMSLQSYSASKYSQDDLDMLVLLSAQCGSALYRTLAEQAFRKAHERASVFGSLAQRLGLATDARDAGQIIAEAADRLIGWDACFFDLYDSQSNNIAAMLNMDIVDGKRQEVPGNHRTGPPTGMERRVLAEGAFLLHQEADLPVDETLENFGDASRPSACLMFAPARTGSQIVAFFSIQSYTPGAYTDDDLATLQALADHSAGALERIRLEANIRISNERYALAARAANDGLWDWDIASGNVHFSSRCRALLESGASGSAGSIEEWLGRVHPDDRAELDGALRDQMDGKTEHFEHEHRLVLPGGSLRWILVRAVTVRSPLGSPARLVGSITDISARKEAEAELVESAFYDPLTGLANRALFTDRLEQCFRRGRRDESARFAVIFMDLDRFKAVNDTYGHGAGDKLLAAVAHRLRRQFRPADTVARLGGDEFTVLVEQFRNERDLAAIASRIVAEMSVPFHVDGQSLRISASIGIATSDQGYGTSDEVLRNADAALYRAKELGKARYEIFDPSMRESIVAAIKMENDIRAALAREEFVLHYQPIFEIRTRRIAGFEALIRWNHPQKGLVLPAEFVPAAEESGLIHEIGEWVLSQACRQIAVWRRDFEAARPCYMSINVSAKQFASPTLADKLEEFLRKQQLPGDALRIEITETALLKEPASVRDVLERWRNAGVRVMLDDFGTGCSSLSHLNHYSVDYLKIDRTFVNGLRESAESQRVVRAVVSLAGVLGMQVVAEGAETQAQCDLLRDLNCDLVQGFFLSHPLPSEEATKLLEHGCHEAASRLGRES